jgi:type IV pilus assembly protein PilN
LINVNLLPKSLQRIREPGYWRVLAVAFPLLVGGVLFGVQYLTNQTIANLERDVVVREDQLALLRPFLDEQRELQSRQQALRSLIAVAEEVRRGQVVWTSEIGALLEYVPALTSESGSPAIDFRSLNVRSVYPAVADANRYEGASIVSEATISGTVRGPEVLAQFVRNLESAPDFGVLFQNASRQNAEDEDDDLFTYNLTVGGFSGVRR